MKWEDEIPNRGAGVRRTDILRNHYQEEEVAMAQSGQENGRTGDHIPKNILYSEIRHGSRKWGSPFIAVPGHVQK